MIAVKNPTWKLLPPDFTTNEGRIVFMLVKVAAKARNTACQRKAMKFIFLLDK